MTDNLLPCPFCKGTDLELARGGEFVWVRCCDIDCTATGPADLGESGAIEKWNAAPRAGWRPIETAPKDGTRILVWPDENDKIAHVWWGRFELYYPGCRATHEWCVVDSGDDQSSAVTVPNPTHWLPLPPPPEASDAP